MDQLVQVLSDAGGEMEFPNFMQAVRSAGLNGSLWLKAKHAGLIETEIDGEGRHIVRVAQAQPEGGA